MRVSLSLFSLSPLGSDPLWYCSRLADGNAAHTKVLTQSMCNLSDWSDLDGEHREARFLFPVW
jgi:hypothetical protein